MLSQREQVLVTYVLQMVASQGDGRRASNVIPEHLDKAEREETRRRVQEFQTRMGV